LKNKEGENYLLEGIIHDLLPFVDKDANIKEIFDNILKDKNEDKSLQKWIKYLFRESSKAGEKFL